MTKLTVSTQLPAGVAKSALAAALALGGALVLAGCEQHPYPTPAPEEAAPPPAPAQLMGAPDTPEGQPAMGPPGGPSAYPPGYTGQPAGSSGDPQGAPPRAPCPPSALPQGPDAPTVIICSAPVPNPAEDVQAYPHRHRHHFHGHFGAGDGSTDTAPAWRAPHHPRHHGRDWSRSSVEQNHRAGYVYHDGHRYRIVGPAHPGHPGHPGVISQHQTHDHVTPAPLATPPVVHPVHPSVVKPILPAPKAQPTPHLVTKPAPTVVAPTKTATSNTVSNTTETRDSNTTANTTSNTTGVTATPAQRYAALQSALATVIAREATLNTPSHFEQGQPADVTLNVPSDFAQTVRQEAAKQDLSDQTASVNLTSALSGSGYTVTPAEPQSQPLTLGEQTVFHWKVTAQADAKGPLLASLNADILSDGQSLPLGPVKAASAAHWTGRVVGVGLLVLIALILLAWAAQRKRPPVTGATKPRETHTNGV